MQAAEQSFEQPKERLISYIDFENSSFEEPNTYDESLPGAYNNKQTMDQVLWNFIPMGLVPGWSTRVVNPGDAANAWAGAIEIDRSGFCNINSKDGRQHAELNALVPGILYQECNTVPGQKVYWEFYHHGRSGVDVMEFMLNGEVIKEASTGNTGWRRYYGDYIIPAGQTRTEFAFKSVSAAGNAPNAGNFLDAISLFYPSFLEVEKSIENVSGYDNSYVLDGDRITYKIVIRNTGETDTSRTVLTDVFPDGLEYIDGSLTMTYTDAQGNTENLDVSGAIFYDEASDMLSVKAGKLIIGATLMDDQSGAEMENVYANGTRTIKKFESVMISFDVLVSGDDFDAGDRIKNQARVYYNDLGFETFNMGSDNVPNDDYNVSNITDIEYREKGTLLIGKELTEESERDQIFLFRIDYQIDALAPITNTCYGWAELSTGDTYGEIVFENMPPGVYHVTELESNWKYQIQDPTKQMQTGSFNGLDVVNQCFSFINTSDEKAWISDNSSVINYYE